MTNLADLRLTPSLLERLGLPDQPYPVPVELLTEAMTTGNELPLALLLRGLQERSAVDGEHWRSHEPAMARLADLLAPADEREVLEVGTDAWWLELAPVDLDGDIVTVQRRDNLVAAVARRHDGRLRATVYRPLDARSADYLTSVAIRPHADGTCAMRENNWEYALDAAAPGMRQMYAYDEGVAYLSYWSEGLGVYHDGTISDVYRQQRALAPRRPAAVAAELLVSAGVGGGNPHIG